MGQFYPRSSIEMEGGDLINIVNVALNIRNGGTVETTMHSAGSGFSAGPVTVEGSFEIKNPTVSERDYIGKVVRKEITDITFKHPDGSRLPLTIMPNEAGVKDQDTGASTTSWGFVGFLKSKL